MQYIQPVGAQGPANAFGNDYVDKNAGLGIAGSFLAADVPEHLLIEVLNAIVAAGLTPSGANLAQLAQAIQSGKSTYAVATGSANAWTVAPNLAVPAYAAGRVLNIIAPATNTSTTVNMNVSGLGDRRIKKSDGSDPAVGDLAGGKVYATIDDGTNIRILSMLPSDVTGLHGVQYFTASGTFVPPDGVTKVFAQLWGAGGGGGGIGVSGGAGGGGGGGEYREGLFSVVPGVSHAVTIGAAGTGGTNAGTNGTSGAASSFGALMTANGGTFGAGTNGASGAGGVGGSGGSGGSFSQAGHNGSNGNGTGTVASGVGGGTWMVPNQYIQFQAGGAGGNGQIYAQGGNGAVGGTGAQPGGNGKAGLLRLEW